MPGFDPRKSNRSSWRSTDTQTRRQQQPPPLAYRKPDQEKHTSIENNIAQPNVYFHSRRKDQGEIDKPWLKERNLRQPWLTLFPLIGIFLGFGLTGFMVWDGLRSNTLPEYCQILDEDFSGGFDEKIWTKEAELGGFGNGQFEQTTVTDENVFIRDGMLIIKPTLQDAKLIQQDSVINYTKQGICTEANQLWSSCVASTNTTNGTIVPPVRSGRINSKKGASIKYGQLPTSQPSDRSSNFVRSY